ncbi:MAG: hypothetical protein GXO49_01375, partial [Chlorobi bacterium]|nr:hypothetical protein [Chlorobiota bacterium]
INIKEDDFSDVIEDYNFDYLYDSSYEKSVVDDDLWLEFASDVSLLPAEITDVKSVSNDTLLSVLKENSNNLVSKIDSLVNSINALSVVFSQIDFSKINAVKELEKEHFEYMKTPQTYTLTDESLPKLAPRDVIALSEAVKAHLNSQEASLTGEELSDFENDLDVSNLITKLFEFKGITEDINNLPKDDNES